MRNVMGGLDGVSYRARGGVANALTPASAEWPIAPRPAFGDLPGGMTIAGGIAAALFARESTGMKGVWAPVQTALELHDDPQVAPNGFVVEVQRDDGVEFPLVASPVMFDEEKLDLKAAPEHGQHTEELLLELGYSWEDIAVYKGTGAVL